MVGVRDLVPLRPQAVRLLARPVAGGGEAVDMDGAVPEGRWITSVMGGIIDRYFNNTQHTPVYTPDLSRPSFQDIYFVDNAFRLTWQVSSRNKVTFSQGYQKRGRTR